MSEAFSLKNINLEVKKVGDECQLQSSDILTVMMIFLGQEVFISFKFHNFI